MAIPYAPSEAYDPRGSRIADLILAAGNARARGAQARGQILGDTIGSLGQIASNYFKDREEAPIREARLKALNQGNEYQGLQIEKAKKEQEDARALSTALAFGVDPQSGAIDPQRSLSKLKDMNRPELAPSVMELVNQHQLASEAIRQRRAGWEGVARDMTGAYAKMILARPAEERLPYAQHILPSLPKEAAAQIQPIIQRVASGEMPLDQALDFLVQSSPSEQKRKADIEAKNAEQKVVAPNAAIYANGAEVYKNTVERPDTRSLEQRLFEARQKGDKATEAAILSTMRDAARATRAPKDVQSGRPVTSGDANRVAQVNDSLSEAAVLHSLLLNGKEGTTGTLAKIGAAVPNWVTDFTGWGEDAKSKQAIIDRVKQVIGKGLEGGVLRKEDERKYEKILPTIGDPREVVQAKMVGLAEALREKRQTMLDAYSDAGYNVSKFQDRVNKSDGEIEWERGPDGKPRRKTK